MKTTRKTFKFKIYENPKKNREFHWQLKIANEIHNHCIALHKRYFKLFKKYLNANKLKNHLTKLRNLPENVHWKELGSQVIQDVAERIDRGYKAFFKKKGKNRGTPKFKKRENQRSFTLKQAGWKLISPNKIQINKTTFGFHKSREIQGIIKTVTIKKDSCGSFWIFFSCDKVPLIQIKECRTLKTAAFDFGLKTFLTCSEGACHNIKSPEFFKKSLKEIKSTSKSLSTKKKGSQHRKAAKLSLAKIHRRVANKRLDFFFKTSRHLIQTYDQIGFEDLNLTGMKKLWGSKISDLAFGTFLATLGNLAVGQKDFEIIKCGRFEKTTGVCLSI